MSVVQKGNQEISVVQASYISADREPSLRLSQCKDGFIANLKPAVTGTSTRTPPTFPACAFFFFFQTCQPSPQTKLPTTEWVLRSSIEQWPPPPISTAILAERNGKGCIFRGATKGKVKRKQHPKQQPLVLGDKSSFPELGISRCRGTN